MNHPIILENCFRGRKYCPYFTSEKLINTEAKWLVQGHKARNCTGGQWVGLHILLSSQVIRCWLQQEINSKVAGVHRRNREINYVNFLQCARNHTKHFMPVFCQNPLNYMHQQINSIFLQTQFAEGQTKTHICIWNILPGCHNLCYSHYVRNQLNNYCHIVCPLPKTSEL